MTALALSCAVLIMLAALLGLLWRRSFHPVFLALVAPLAAAGAALLGLTASAWEGAEYSDALFLAAGWLPVWLVSFTGLYGAFLAITKKGKPGRGYWVFTAAAAAIAAFYAWSGGVHHPVESLLSLGNIGWFLMLLGLAEGVFTENAADVQAGLRRTMFLEGAFTAAFGAMFGMWEQHLGTGGISLSSPLVMSCAAVTALNLAAALRSKEKGFPHLTAAALLFAAGYGFFLEFS